MAGRVFSGLVETSTVPSPSGEDLAVSLLRTGRARVSVRPGPVLAAEDEHGAPSRRATAGPSGEPAGRPGGWRGRRRGPRRPRRGARPGEGRGAAVSRETEQGRAVRGLGCSWPLPALCTRLGGSRLAVTGEFDSCIPRDGASCSEALGSGQRHATVAEAREKTGTPPPAKARGRLPDQPRSPSHTAGVSAAAGDRLRRPPAETACGDRLRRPPAETACGDRLRRPPAETACGLAGPTSFGRRRPGAGSLDKPDPSTADGEEESRAGPLRGSSSTDCRRPQRSRSFGGWFHGKRRGCVVALKGPRSPKGVLAPRDLVCCGGSAWGCWRSVAGSIHKLCATAVEKPGAGRFT